jgi:phosphatidylinositol alpha-1,6-mannosyltransferase
MDIVVSYDYAPKIGGAHTWLHEVYRRWSSPVRIFTLGAKDSIEARAQHVFDSNEHGALEVFREAVPFSNLSLLNAQCLNRFRLNVQRIRRLTGRGPLQLHSLRAFPEGFTSLLYAWTAAGKPRLITYAHGEEILIARSSAQLSWMARHVYARSDLVISNSESTRRLVKDLCPTARVTCINPGVDPQAFKLPSEDIRAYRRGWDWPPGTLVLCTVARMEPRKNHAAVIRAVASLREQGLPLGYVCGGDGPEHNRLRELAATLGVGKSVLFAGAVSEQEKKLIFAAADIHVMPSVRVAELIEGFGLVFLEAAAAGTPSISGNDGGQVEAICDGRTGIAVDGSSDEQVTAAIRLLATDGTMRSRMRVAALNWAAEHAWDKIASRIEAEVRALSRG